MLTPGLPVVYVPNINFISRGIIFDLTLAHSVGKHQDIHLVNSNYTAENFEI